MNRTHYFLFLLLAGIVSSCVDPYYPELDKYENTLAVDGLITSGNGPYFVRLQVATTIYKPIYQPVSNATVYITDNLGNSEEFVETEPGLYSNINPDYQGIVGRSYQLTVSLSDDNTYQSGWETIEPPLGIDSVYAELEYHIDPVYPYTLSGYQFYVDTKQAVADSIYILWRMQSTYQYHADYKCTDMYIGRIVPFPKSDSLFTCWKTKMVPEIVVGTTSSRNSNQLIRYPLHYVSGEDRDLSLRYSVLVNQYVVSETVYNYWKSLRDQNEIQGSLYSQQPYQIRGNVRNINNAEEAVFGGFAAAGIAQKRVFYNNPGIEFNYEICIINDADYEDMKNLRASKPYEWPIYLSRDVNHRLFYPQQRCIDCRMRGGQLEKPDFWIDN